MAESIMSPRGGGEEDRLLVMSSLRMVDAAILGSTQSYEETLDRVRPDVVSGLAERRIAGLNVERDPTDRGQNKGRALVVDAPPSPRSGRAGLAL